MRSLIAVAVFGLSFAAACAEDGASAADVVCSKTHDIALVRFNNDSFTPLPSSVDGGLSKDAGSGRTDCTAHWGAMIRVRDGTEQAFAYGAGGADPPAFFSLWIDKRKIFSRRDWKPGYADIFNHASMMIVGLVIRPNRLTVCSVTYGVEGIGPVNCQNELLKVAHHPVDKYEYPDKPMAQRPVGTIYANAKSPRLELCRQRLAAAGDTHLQRLANLDAIKLEDAGSFLHRVGGAFANVEGWQVFIYGSTDHYFDGDIVVMVPPNVPASDVTAWFEKIDLETELQSKLPAGWRLWAGGRERLYPKVSPRYVHFTPQAIDGQLYFLAVPTNWDVEPAAALVLPRVDGGFEISCAFHVVKAHF